LPLFSWQKTIPNHWLEVPGVYKNKRNDGGRVPHNAHGILGLPPVVPASGGLRTFDKLVTSACFPSWMKSLPTEYQRRTTAGALSREGFHAWAPPGAGKTLMGLIWLAAARQAPKLVITRAHARWNWKEEVRKYTRFRPVMLTGKTPPPDFKVDPRCIYITSFSTIIDWRETLLQSFKGGWLCIDEIHWCKNRKRVKPVVQPDGSTKWQPLGNQAAAMHQLCGVTARRFGLTATPVPNRLSDLWAQLDLAEPWQWGNFHGFGVRYCGAWQDTYGWKYDGISNKRELKQRLNHCRRVTPQSDLARMLPPFRRQLIRLPHSEQDNPARMKEYMKKMLRGGSAWEGLLAEAATRKRTYVTRKVVEEAKAGMKIVVFTGRRKDCESLAKAIRRKLPDQIPMWWAHGGTSGEERHRIRDEYMAHQGACVLVGTGNAWGESINLQDTDLALMVMLPWEPEKLRQWEGRFPRLGQQRPVVVSYIICEGTADERMSETMLEKLPIVGLVADDEEAQKLEETLADTKEGDSLLQQLISRGQRK